MLLVEGEASVWMAPCVLGRTPSLPGSQLGHTPSRAVEGSLGLQVSGVGGGIVHGHVVDMTPKTTA